MHARRWNRYNPLKFVWDPRLVFTGITILGYNPDTGALDWPGACAKRCNPSFWATLMLHSGALLMHCSLTMHMRTLHSQQCVGRPVCGRTSAHSRLWFPR